MMSKQEPGMTFDESRSGKLNDEGLTTADMAAAAVTSAERKPASDPNYSENRQPAISPDKGFEPLFNEAEADEFRSRWYNVQAGFVDEPRQSVADADELVANVMKRLAQVFAAERENLEHEWDGGDNVSTEDLRVALRRYRSFFDRLLSV
jgi:hypothetical protein